MDGCLIVSCRGKILTPGEAPPLAAELRASVDAYHANGDWDKLAEEELHDPIPEKRIHRDMVLAGMERARLQGRPPMYVKS